MQHSSQSKTHPQALLRALEHTTHTGTPGYLGPTGQPHAKLLYNSECCLKLADLKAIQTQQKKLTFTSKYDNILSTHFMYKCLKSTQLSSFEMEFHLVWYIYIYIHTYIHM